MSTLNPASVDQGTWAALRTGFTVDRAAATLPATTATNYFTVAGGRVLAYFLGEVTTVIQTQACNAKLIHHPTTGTDMDLCAVLNITAKEVGTLFGITGSSRRRPVGWRAGVPAAECRHSQAGHGAVVDVRHEHRRDEVDVLLRPARRRRQRGRSVTDRGAMSLRSASDLAFMLEDAGERVVFNGVRPSASSSKWTRWRAPIGRHGAGSRHHGPHRNGHFTNLRVDGQITRAARRIASIASA
jgi:hypothetical protein